jgi:hypothetical protein
MRFKFHTIILLYCITACSSGDNSGSIRNEEAEEGILPPDNFPYVFAEKPSTGKSIYIPNDLQDNNFNSNSSHWSYQRSASSENVILFWEKGFGQYPSKTANTAMQVNIQNLLDSAEKQYVFYRDTLKFVDAGTSQSDEYRMMIFLIYQEEWLATGAGYDNVIGALWINPTTTAYNSVIGHEFGHSFQYQVHCDGNYGFRDQNYVGTFWEQCAQFMSWQMNNEDYSQDIPYFLTNAHKNFSHEDIRYQSIYLMEYWKQKHGMEFLGKVWKEALEPEHPLQTYKRIAGIDQEQLNDEVFEYACKNITWDYPLGSYNRKFITSLPVSQQLEYEHTTQLDAVEDGYYQIAEEQIPQAYGYNAIKLQVPPTETEVTVEFEGLENEWSSIAGWRWGFVRILTDGKPVYEETQKTELGTTSVTITDNTSELWFLVSGAPTEHINHIWDDDNGNDENFPYRLKFTNTTPE